MAAGLTTALLSAHGLPCEVLFARKVGARQGQNVRKPLGSSAVVLPWAGRTPRAAFVHLPASETLWEPGKSKRWEVSEQALAGGRAQEVPSAAMNQGA